MLSSAWTVYNSQQGWYWKASDGRIYASAKSALVAADDSDLKTWQTVHGQPSVWPLDATGKQTDASLSSVLTTYGLEAFNG